MDRVFFEIENHIDCTSLEITQYNPDSLYVTVRSDWAGDTETGFGVVCDITVQREDVQRLAQFLDSWLTHTLNLGSGEPK